MKKPNPPTPGGAALQNVLKGSADDFQTMQEAKSPQASHEEQLASLTACWSAADTKTQRAFLARIGAIVGKKSKSDKGIAIEDLNASNDE